MGEPVYLKTAIQQPERVDGVWKYEWVGVYLIPSSELFCVKNLINQREVCNHVGFNSQQQILDRQTMPPRRRKMGIVSLNLGVIPVVLR